VRFGSLRRLRPISASFGYDRGLPVDRYYIETFLARHGGPSGDIRGHVLEVGDDTYTRSFGSSRVATGGGVTKVDILDVDERNPAATLVADLASGDNLPSETFDCVICTQTLQYLYDVRAAIATLARIMKPGGVLLATLPGIYHACQAETCAWGDYWRFTSLSARRLCEEAFPADAVHVEAYGNVLSATAFLQGLAAEELKPAELEFRDPDFEVTVAARAAKAS
jgi:SAM-dependent methyltransferase